jgi:hypothetical protein
MIKMAEEEEKQLMAFICMGENSRASTLVMDRKKLFKFDKIMNDLKKFMKDEMKFNYDTIEISVKGVF